MNLGQTVLNLHREMLISDPLFCVLPRRQVPFPLHLMRFEIYCVAYRNWTNRDQSCGGKAERDAGLKVERKWIVYPGSWITSLFLPSSQSSWWGFSFTMQKMGRFFHRRAQLLHKNNHMLAQLGQILDKNLKRDQERKLPFWGTWTNSRGLGAKAGYCPRSAGKTT